MEKKRRKRIRILKFTTGTEVYEDNGFYSAAFLSQAGESYDYSRIYSQLGEVRFLVHLHHAKQQDEKGDINYAGLFKTFGQFRFNNIRKALRNGGVTLFDPTCPERDFPSNYWQYDLNSWLKNNQLTVMSSDWNMLIKSWTLID